MVKVTPAVMRLDALLRPAIDALGYELVRIRLQGGGKGHQVLQIMAEPKGGEREMTVEDCAQISRHVSAIMDVEDPISGAYNLEVSSPGIDRPLVGEKDFKRYVGFEANVEMEWPIEGRKRFKGEILNVKDGVVRLKLDAENETTLDIDGMQSAKLVLTDALIAAHLEKQRKAAS